MVTSVYEVQRPDELGPRVPAASPSGMALLAVMIASAAVFFWEGLVALGEAWQTAEYSHGPLIPLLSGYLFLRHLKVVPVDMGPVTDRWPGFAALVLSVLLAALGKFARIPDVVAYAMIVFVGGVVLVSFGFRRGWLFWPSVLHLVFMLPLPGTLYWKVSTYLQFVSSEFGVFLIRLVEIPVYLEGNIIDLGVYKLHVAEACSGLRYLFPIMSFSYVFATLYRGPVWHKAVLLLSAAPIAVIMNSIRIGIIGIVVNYTGLEHVEGLTHLLEGWVIFITCVVMLFALAKLMLMLQGGGMTLAESLDLEVQGIGPQMARLRLVQPSAALIAGTVLFAIAATVWHVIPPRETPAIRRENLLLFPDNLGPWQLQTHQVLEPRIARALGADDYFAAAFTREGTPGHGDVFIAWYRDQTRGGIHSPEICLPAGGWEMADIRRVDMADRFGTDDPFPINRAIIQKGEARLLVYYWFEQYGGRNASDFLAKAALLWNAARFGRTDGALVRVITPILPGETEEESEERLLSITRPVIAELGRFVPRHAGL